ncbi:probable G- coupled receptor CG31760 [Paramuricea clavata]|nr:probable G- coupled receptor CG31760 [Paramuricea clavata]
MIELTDRTLLKYLSLMLVAVLCYLMIWTWTQTHESEIKMTSAGFKYKRCVREWFSNAIEIGEVLLLLWGVWLCLRVRNAPSAYNESKYIAWCIYNTVFIMILVGLLRIVLDNFHNPDVSYVVDFLSTHVVATILLALLFISKIYHLRKFKKDTQRRNRANSATSTTVTDLRKSPFHLNRLVDGTLVVCEIEEERTVVGLESENIHLREEIRNLNAKLAIFENKLARESKRLGSSPEDDYKLHHSDSPIISADSETESSRDGNGFSDKHARKCSAAAESTASNGSVFGREERGGSLIEHIKNAGKQDNFLVVPKQNSVSDEETLTVMSNISNESP